MLGGNTTTDPFQPPLPKLPQVPNCGIPLTGDAAHVESSSSAALKMSHILHMAEDTAGAKDYFLTLQHRDLTTTSAEVREGSSSVSIIS